MKKFFIFCIFIFSSFSIFAFDIRFKTSVSENLRLRLNVGLLSEVICTIQAGSEVTILEWELEQKPNQYGNYDKKLVTIDGIESAWAKISTDPNAKDRNGKPLEYGTTGWVFGGYLQQENVSETYKKDYAIIDRYNYSNTDHHEVFLRYGENEYKLGSYDHGSRLAIVHDELIKTDYGFLISYSCNPDGRGSPIVPHFLYYIESDKKTAQYVGTAEECGDDHWANCYYLKDDGKEYILIFSGGESISDSEAFMIENNGSVTSQPGSVFDELYKKVKEFNKEYSYIF